MYSRTFLDAIRALTRRDTRYRRRAGAMLLLAMLCALVPAQPRAGNTSEDVVMLGEMLVTATRLPANTRAVEEARIADLGSMIVLARREPAQLASAGAAATTIVAGDALTAFLARER